MYHKHFMDKMGKLSDLKLIPRSGFLVERGILMIETDSPSQFSSQTGNQVF